VIGIIEKERLVGDSGHTFQYKTLKEYAETIGGRIDPSKPD